MIINKTFRRLVSDDLAMAKDNNSITNLFCFFKNVSGEKNGFFDSVVFNSAAALTISEQSKNLKDGVRIAADTLLSGKTQELIKNLKGSKTFLK